MYWLNAAAMVVIMVRWSHQDLSACTHEHILPTIRHATNSIGEYDREVACRLKMSWSEFVRTHNLALDFLQIPIVAGPKDTAKGMIAAELQL